MPLYLLVVESLNMSVGGARLGSNKGDIMFRNMHEKQEVKCSTPFHAILSRGKMSLPIACNVVPPLRVRFFGPIAIASSMLVVLGVGLGPSSPVEAAAVHASSETASPTVVSPESAQWCTTFGGHVIHGQLANGGVLKGWTGLSPNIPVCGPLPKSNPTGVTPMPGGSGFFVGFQCVELADRWLYVAFGLRLIPGNGDVDARDYYNKYHSNDPNLKLVDGSGGVSPVHEAPSPGDVISFSNHSNFQDANGGHVAVVVAVDPSVTSSGNGNVYVAQENFDTSNLKHWYDAPLSMHNWQLTKSGRETFTYAQWLKTGYTPDPTPTPTTNCGISLLTSTVSSYISQSTQYTRNEYTITNIKTAGSNPVWASFDVQATAAGAATFQNASGVAECTSSWQVKDIGGSDVGCATVPTSLQSQLGISCPSPKPTAGNGSPEDAVDGFISSVLAGNDMAACQYLEPTAQPTCQSAATSEPIITGTFSIIGQVINGSEALVSVTGNECQGGSCESNSDPNSGMPPGAGPFASAYTTAVAAVSPSNPTMSFSPVPCVRINGDWYVNLGI